MKDEFDDHGMGLPDEEMTGGSDLHDLDAGSESDIELDIEGGERTGRPSGGARTHAPASPRKSSGGGQKSAAKKSAAPKAAAKKSSAPKAAARKSSAPKAAAKKSASRKKKSGKMAARKGPKKAASKAGKSKKKRGGRR
jgi:hypothetical protein